VIWPLEWFAESTTCTAPYACMDTSPGLPERWCRRCTKQIIQELVKTWTSTA
jgi:hypothetical protein